MVVKNMDFDGFFRNKVESMLITASWVEQVQKMLDLKGVSQVWGDKPEWYVWINRAPGAYALVFEEGEIIEAADQDLILGHFAVKCYPYVEARVFDGFSPREREMVAGDLFDRTGTPRLEARKAIPEAFFTVGSISIMLDAAENVAMFTFDSLDFLKWSILNVTTDQEKSTSDVPDRKSIRSIPGWQIGYPLFDRLISLYAFYSKRTPALMGATRSPGFECVVDSNQSPESRDCHETRQWSASMLFLKPTDSALPANTFWRAHLDPNEKIVYEHNFEHPVVSQQKNNGGPPVTVNPLWWELAQSNLKSELASTCGCIDHEAHTCEAGRFR